jgi:hypothetical protein
MMTLAPPDIAKDRLQPDDLAPPAFPQKPLGAHR